MRVLITGGAGFVGSSLALSLKRHHPEWAVMALDNLKRRGSEMALARLAAEGVMFQHGDVRAADDLESVGAVDLLIDCSAEPSVQAGYHGNPKYVLDTNLAGTINCLEHLRRQGGDLIFLSTSRVYPIAALRGLPLRERGDRFDLADGVSGLGWSAEGINEEFPLSGSRSLYGATKLAGELLIEEYRQIYGLRTIVNRCGVLSGPWQMGKVDQGFVVLWMARHLYGGPLHYMGFGGRGLQVRDVLHVDDLCSLIAAQIQHIGRLSGAVFNVGGGATGSISLRELSRHCARLAGHDLAIGSEVETQPADVPFYISDSRAVADALGWRPQKNVPAILSDIHRWLVDNRDRLAPLLAQQRDSA